MFDIRSAKILFAEAEKLNLSPQWLTDYGLFSIQVKGKTEYVFYSKSVLNSQVHSYLAKNKHATRVILANNGFLNIPFCLPKSLEEAVQFLKEHKTIIAKPTLGQHSERIRLIEAVEKLQELDLAENILEKFIKGKEYRCLVLKGDVIAVHHKQYDTPINEPDRVQRVSLEQSGWSSEMVATAVRVAEVMHLQVAAVDFMVDAEGKQYILEVNSSPGIARFHYPSKGPGINLAKRLLEAHSKE